MMNMKGSIVARYTDSEGKEVYVYMDSDGVLHTITQDELRIWYALYHEQQLDRLVFGDNLPAGGGVPPEQWAIEHRIVPWSQLRILARLINEHHIKPGNPKIRRTPIGKNDKENHPKGTREPKRSFSVDDRRAGFKTQSMDVGSSASKAYSFSAPQLTTTGHHTEEKLPESREKGQYREVFDKIIPHEGINASLGYPWRGSLAFSPSGRHLMADGYPYYKKVQRLEVIPKNNKHQAHPP